MASSPTKNVLRARHSKSSLSRASPSRPGNSSGSSRGGGAAGPGSPVGATTKSRRAAHQRTDSSEGDGDSDDWEDHEDSKKRRKEQDQIVASAPTPTPTNRARPAPTPSKKSQTAGLGRRLRSLLLLLLGPSARVGTFGISMVWSCFMYLLPLICAIGLACYCLSSVRSFGKSLLLLLPSAPSLAPLTALYCSTIRLGCNRSAPTQAEIDYQNIVSQTTRTTAVKVEQAKDIFGSLLNLGDGSAGSAGALHPVEMWELATAVKYSGLAERDFLGAQLNDLEFFAVLTTGNVVRSLKDNLIEINSLGINSLTWESNKQKRRRRSTAENDRLSASINEVYEQIDFHLQAILDKLEMTIPLSTRTSDQARQLFDELSREDRRIDEMRQESSPLMRFISESGALVVGTKSNFKARQLKKDYDLTRVSASSVSVLHRGLEETRTSLLEYKHGVGSYKASVIGYQLGGAGLDVDEEVEHLEKVMDDFKRTLQEVKNRSKPGGSGAKTLPM
ncbi:BZ3500_MvSof-1268-A1-R1_Chr6-3g08746 [Microbotryum saponariae]|uniref:BZ3500_MvSof-1268-A1-R1_Chr6-3g08746 protein n=1 Tax=Microbotryum saponariae TaxID=289078 RepID=A0A2X0NNK4_9BASI|nr:BZ3500_MvSof-1268-A1-R1_Chr6-3g08746 [Microbotryum saponariae]SDA07347.1 BZ3501_MvSof-1269-A2-R1_Chr6-2g08449 [Microbotryum saponariae]